MNKLKNELKIDKTTYIWTFIVVYLMDSLLFATNSSTIFYSLKMYGVVALAAILLFRYEFIKKQKTDIIIYFLTLNILASMALAGGLRSGYFYYLMIACIWVAYLLSREYSIEQFSYCYCRIMRVIAIVSLIAWVFSSQIKSIGILPVITNTVGVRYKFLFFTCVPESMALANRNMGPFWEPGAYQMFLNLALFFTLFVEKHKLRLFDCILLIVTCISTKSGAAFLPIALIIAAYALEKKRIGSFFMVLSLGIVLYIMYNLGMFEQIFEKMGSEHSDNSITYRWIGIETGIRAFLNNPIFGSTLKKTEEIRQSLAMKYLGVRSGSNTNTFMYYFGYYGLLVGWYMISRTFKFFRKNLKSWLATVLVFLGYFISTCNENFMASLVVVMLVFLQSEEVMRKKRETEIEQSESCAN